MTLFETVSEDIKKAMLAKDRVALDALRGIKKEFLEAKTAKGTDGELHDDVALKILQKMIKQRKESAEMYIAGNRQDLADAELAQAKVIEQYLPKQMTEEEIKAAVKDIIAQTGASSMADMGKVMGAATKALAGKADGKAISLIGTTASTNCIRTSRPR